MLTAGVELINCRGSCCTFLRLLFLLQYQRNHLHPCKYSPLGQILHQQSQPRLVGTAGRNASSTLSNMPRWKIEHEQRDSTSTTASLSAVKRSIDSLLYHKLVKSRREAVVIGRILLRDYKLLEVFIACQCRLPVDSPNKTLATTVPSFIALITESCTNMFWTFPRRRHDE